MRLRPASSPPWLCVALLIALGAAPLQGRATDLLQAYQQARRADPVLAAADANRLAVRETIGIARAPLLPQASVGLAVDQTHADGSNGPGNTGDNRSRGISLGVTQVVVDVSRLSQLRVAQAQSQSQDASHAAAEQALLTRVARAYFDVLTAEDALANAQANEAAFAQQVQQASDRQANGLTAAVDVEQARAYHASARAATVVAGKSLADAQEALSEITGQPTQPGDRLAHLRDDLPLDPPAPADAQAWIDQALAQNPTLLAQRASISAADNNIDAARSAHLPTVSATLNAGRASAWPQPASYNGRNVATVGLLLNVPLFSGGATQAQVRQAQYQRDGAASELEIRRRRVAREVLAQYRGVLAGIDQTQATRAAVDAARKALASTRVGQQLGTQTMNELLQTIQTVGAAQNAHSLARHQFTLSRLLLLQASGSITEADLAAVNALLE